MLALSKRPKHARRDIAARVDVLNGEGAGKTTAEKINLVAEVCVVWVL